jgi:hypothetical protein
MSSSSQSHFAIEGGKFFLADALFYSFKYRIRCPHCAGNLDKPGFIKDQAGKACNSGQARRQWACQQSNGKGITSKCPRASCTEYINLAIDQLDSTQVHSVIAQVCHQYPPHQAEYAHLQAYQPESVTSPASTLSDWQRPEKRKAVDDLEEQATKTTRYVSHPTPQKTTLFQTSTALQSAIEPLEALVQMSQTWSEQLKLLQAFLSPNPGRPSVSSEPTSSPSPRSHVSSTTAPSSSPLLSLCKGQSLSLSQTKLPPSLPCETSPPTHQVEALSSSPTLSIRHGIEGAKRLSRHALDQHPLNPINSLYITKVSQSNSTFEEPVSTKRAKDLVQQFRQGNKIERINVRQKARIEGLYGIFQQYMRPFGR